MSGSALIKKSIQQLKQQKDDAVKREDYLKANEYKLRIEQYERKLAENQQPVEKSPRVSRKRPDSRKAVAYPTEKRKNQQANIVSVADARNAMGEKSIDFDLRKLKDKKVIVDKIAYYLNRPLSDKARKQLKSKISVLLKRPDYSVSEKKHLQTSQDVLSKKAQDDIYYEYMIRRAKGRAVTKADKRKTAIEKTYDLIGADMLIIPPHHTELSKTFKIDQIDFAFEIGSVSQKILHNEIENVEDLLKPNVNGYINYITRKYPNSTNRDKFSIVVTYIDTSGNRIEKESSINMFTKDNIENALLKAIANIIISRYEDNDLDKALVIRYKHYNLPYGGHYLSHKIDYQTALTKKSVIEIKNKDNFCCIYAVLIARAYQENKSLYKHYMATFNVVDGKPLGVKLIKDKDSFLSVNHQLTVPIPLAQLNSIEDIIQYRIIVFSDEEQKIIFTGNEQYDKVIYLLHHNNHYDVITKMNAFLGHNYFCNDCLKAYDIKTHNCRERCFMCRGVCDIKDKTVDYQQEKHGICCLKCNRHFRSIKCFETHLKNDMCSTIMKCRKCSNNYHPKDEHKCFHQECKRCHKIVNVRNHICFMTKKQLKKGKPSIITYDIETINDNGYMIPNVIVAFDTNQKNVFVPNRMNDTVKERLLYLINKYENLTIKYCDDIVKSFIEYLYQHKGSTVIAHNNKGFDGQFIKRYFLKNTHIKPKVVRNGAKIMKMTIPYYNLTFVDSLNFFMCPLKALPSIFGLNTYKGDYPYKFNTYENENYIGKLSDVDISYYDLDVKYNKEKDKQDFVNWYSQHCNDDFCNMYELVDYCIKDVDILNQSVLKFDELLNSILLTEYDKSAFKYTTIASHAKAILLHYFLTENQILIDMPKGNKDSSISCEIWLRYRDQYLKGKIKREHKIGKYTVDGFHNDTNTVYEYLGCYWHGCPKCHKQRGKLHNHKHTSMFDVYQDWIEKYNWLKNAGYNVLYMWEHDFIEKKKTDKNFRKFADELELFNFEDVEMNKRDSFFGGRTNASKLYYEAHGDEKIRYADITSLYPTVNKYDVYPVGIPKKLTHFENTDISGFLGFVKCAILPPRGLYHPVLPHRCEKLTFPLCRTCVEKQQVHKCEHTDDERMLYGTWTTPELTVAIENGYKITKIYEVEHYEKYVQGIFKDYINMFLKIKQECSGYPKWVKTDIDKDLYIRNYYEHEGIRLDKSKIMKNSGLRFIAKIYLNSLWGKFGQRPNMTQTIYFNENDVGVYQNMITNYTVLNKNKKMTINRDSLNIQMLDDNLMEVSFKEIQEEDENESSVNIASFTTAHARMRLYEKLKYLGDRVIYYDTDSIIYVDRNDGINIELDDYLGDWTNELEDYGFDYCKKFVSIAPKVYAYQLPNDTYVSKIKGFTRNLDNAEQLSFDVLEKIATTKSHVETMTYNHFKIHRVGTIEVKAMDKKLSYTYSKRVISNTEYNIDTGKLICIDTIPYGF